MLQQTIEEMKNVFQEAPYGIEHTLHVYENARAIMAGENLAPGLHEVTEIATILHDIGVLEAQRKYGSMEGPYQEKEGEIIARQILEKLAAPPALLERVCYIVGRHHTLSAIDGPDFQVLWDADLLENLEAGKPRKAAPELEKIVEEQFQTASGRQLARARLLKD
jgi:HD superfamily phosphodiesterase